MQKNIKKMFLLITLVFLLVGLGTITASDVNQNHSTHNFNEKQINEVNAELSANTQNSPTTKSIINKNQSTKTKQNSEPVATTLTLEFNSSGEENSGENYKTTHLNDEYTLNIFLTDDENNIPISGQIQLYLPEQSEPVTITLNDSGYAQQTYISEHLGQYFIYAEYEGNENYQAATSEVLLLNTELYFPTLTIKEFDNPCYNSTITIEGTLYNASSPMINEELIISFNDNQITTLQTDNNGEYAYNYSLENIPIQESAIISVDYISNYEEMADAHNQVEFDIELIKNYIEINNIENTVVANNLSITGKITDENNKNYTGTIRAVITNKNANEEVYNNSIILNNGVYDFNFIPKSSGIYKLSITTPKDEYYLDCIKSIEFIVTKATPILYVEDLYESIVQENVSIEARVVNEYQQPLENVEIILSTSTELMGTAHTDENGYFHFTEYIFHETIEDENKIIYIDINADDNYYSLHCQSQNYVSRRNVNVTLNTDEGVKINGTLHINGKVDDAYNESLIPEGTIRVYIDDNMVKDNIPLTNGAYESTIEINDNYIGKEQLNIEAFFIPNNPQIYYSENFALRSVDHDLLESQITIEVNDCFVGEDNNISIILSDENNIRLNKSISIKITDTDTDIIVLDETKELTNGTVNVTFTPNNQGMYHVIVEFDGEENIYNKSIEEDDFIVSKIDTALTLNQTSNQIYVNDTVKFNGTLTDMNNIPLSNQEIKIIINSSTETIEKTVTTSINGIYQYDFKAPHSEQYNITVIYEGTSKYNNNYTNTSIRAIKHDTQINIQNIDSMIKYNSTITFRGEVLDKETNNPANGSVTLYLNNEIIDTVTLVNGQFTSQHQIKTTQNNILTVKFNENDVYMESEETINFNTVQLNTIITVNSLIDTQINKSLIIAGTVKDENNNNVNGQLQVRINGQLLSENIRAENGLFSFTYRTNKVGENILNITVLPDEFYYNTTTELTTFNVIRADLQLTNTQMEIDDKEKTITITGQLINDNEISTSGIPVNITVNKTIYTVLTSSDGTFTVTTDKLTPNEYDIHLKVNQTEYFNKLEYDYANAIVEKFQTIINLDNIANVTYSKDLFITGNLTDNYGRTLKEHDLIIVVENHEYPTKTDNHGRYNITANNFHAGINKLNITVPETEYTHKATLNTTFNANKDTAKIILNPIETVMPGETITISGQLINSENHNLTQQIITISINEKTYHATTDSNGTFSYELTNVMAGNYTIAVFFEDSNYNKTNATAKFNVNKAAVQLVVDDIVARVGEYITFRARLTDEYSNPVTGGNIVFKLNGRTLRSDGRFDTNTPSVLKFNVINGIVECTLTADLYLRHGKNISASYSGSYRYQNAVSNVAQANIQLRYVNINVTTSVNTVKHHENITFIAKVNDVTPNSDKNLLNQNASVIFKLNGVSIKDKDNHIIKTVVKDNVAVLNYNVTTMAGVDKSNNLRDYLVTAVYDNPNYYPVNNKNNTTFNVERSIVNIGIQEAKVSGTSLSLKANLTDYTGKNVVGKSTICIKINGVTYKEDNMSKYYTINDGVINISNINVEGMKVKSLEIVTGQRLAYYSARQKTTNITY